MTNLLDMNEVIIDPAWSLRIPAQLARRRQVLPFAAVGETIFVACADRSDTSALQAVSRHLKGKIQPEPAEPDSLRHAIERVFGTTGVPDVTVSGATDDAISLVDEMLNSAIIRGASDLHLDPDRDGVAVRLRVDGELESFRRVSTSAYSGMLSRIKVLSRMDIAEKRSPQDGRFHFRHLSTGKEIDIRTASLPTSHGEKLTLRLLAIHTGDLTLKTLGMSPQHLEMVQRALQQMHGLVLLTGPTGSGKTTTLYAALRHLLGGREINIVTVEDPVEYDIAGVAQVEISGSGDKMTFARALRSVLRHDPDVIMIGEIRDAETANIAIKASLTGHLVLSTLHTNSAADVVTRLMDMGVPRYLLGPTWRLAIAQRLVRKLCRHCRHERQITPQEARMLGQQGHLTHAHVYEPIGCKYCAGRGYVGRMGIFEMLPGSQAIEALITSTATVADLEAYMAQHQLPLLQEDLLTKATSGEISISDALSNTMIP